MLHIDIYQDTVCPWCRIGKRNLEVALERWDQPDVTRSYHTFFLNDAIPAEGVDFRSYMRDKIGGRAPLDALFEGPRRAGERVGLVFNFSKIERAPNTTRSHRLITLTPDARKGAVIDSLYKAYFEDGRDLGDLEVLLDVAQENGLDREQTAALLRGDTAEAQVLAEAIEAHQMGITGVPFFVFNGRYGLSGAQPPDAMLRALKQIEQRGLAEQGR